MLLPHSLSRRSLISRTATTGFAASAAMLLGTGSIPADAVSVKSATSLSGYPFTMGVASGDPLPNSVVLWTRLAPEPLAPDGLGGMPQKPVKVRWQVAEDPAFRKVVKSGTVTATPDLGHSVHPEVWGLRPGRDYWYRFLAAGEVSQTGHTRTAPAYGSSPSRVSFAFASCALYSHGFYTAYQHLADEDVDVVFHLGDYLYESGVTAENNRRNTPVAPSLAGETLDLARYRLQYGLYKSDPDLMAAHQSHAFVVAPDDHEVENNWADEIPEERSQSQGELWMPRRTAAFQAYYEHLPFRASALPEGPDMQIYRSLRYGDLVDAHVLDTRQYRDDQAYADGSDPASPELTPDIYDPSRSMMGFEQEAWLQRSWRQSRARWQVLANQAPMAETDLDDSEAKTLYMDPWDGYVANRNRLLAGARTSGVENLVVITGDRHQNYASNLLADYDDPESAVIGSEFVGTSITSGGDGADMTTGGETLLRANDHLKFFNGQRGYVRVQVTPDELSSDFRVVPYVERQGAPVSTRATYVVENGRPGVQLDTKSAPVGTRYADVPMPTLNR
ncbi:alkaline phosphatase D family protein [Nocardioides sp.]|uniref:alkaline phosphatase D family protein n=1 Tax=Nocardioides sp. TaxID=35761 RepID=UPI00198C11E6|nr:alkaline phosphatase D family protein [Nocardioides sp.]MBC7279475.1 alkaline phosphatase D family protein [Nocardioides sp.]